MPNDPVRKLLLQLNRLGPPPELLPTKDNYYFNLKLKNPIMTDSSPSINIELSKSNAIDSNNNEQLLMLRWLNKKENQFDLKKQMRKSISNILRDLPVLPSEASISDQAQYVKFKLSDVLKAGKRLSVENEDLELNDRIKKGLDLLYKSLQDENNDRIIGEEELQNQLVKDILLELDSKTKYVVELEKKLKSLQESLKELTTRREYLNSQLDMYNTYFRNTLNKTFKGDNNESFVKNVTQNDGKKSNAISNSDDVSVMGPFTFKFKELLKKNVIIDSSLDHMTIKLVRISFCSTVPGKFTVSVGLLSKIVETQELDLNELLAKQANKEHSIKFGGHPSITCDVDALIQLLNKLFVVKEKGTRRRTVLKPLSINHRRTNSHNIK